MSGARRKISGGVDRPLAGIRNGDLILLASIIFLSGDCLFAAHLTPLLAVVVLIGCGSALAIFGFWRFAPSGQFLFQPVRPLGLAAASLAALGLVVLGGEGHLFYANSDWLVRDAVLNDLSRTSGLPHYNLGGADYVLRAPIGMYMLPAASMAALDPSYAPIALCIQNAILLGIVLYLVGCMSVRHRLTVVMLIIAAGGWAIVGTAIAFAVEHKSLSIYTVPSHIEWWISFWQYSSHVTQIFWVPNHAIPGWWLALLILLCASDELPVGAAGISVALTAFWSPLAALGAVPLLMVVTVSRWRSAFGSKLFWFCLGASAFFFPIAEYMTASWATVGDNQRAAMSPAELTLLALLFFVVQVPQFVWLICTLGSQEWWRRLLVLSAGIFLMVLPFANFGPSNDLVMRGSIPAFFIISWIFCDTLVNGSKDRPALRTSGIVLLLLSIVTPINEIGRTLIFPRYAISNCNLAQVQNELSKGKVATNYMAKSAAMSSRLLARNVAPALIPNRRECWPDYPFDPTHYVGFSSDYALLREMSERRRSAAIGGSLVRATRGH